MHQRWNILHILISFKWRHALTINEEKKSTFSKSRNLDDSVAKSEKPCLTSGKQTSYSEIATVQNLRARNKYVYGYILLVDPSLRMVRHAEFQFSPWVHIFINLSLHILLMTSVSTSLNLFWSDDSFRVPGEPLELPSNIHETTGIVQYQVRSGNFRENFCTSTFFKFRYQLVSAPFRAFFLLRAR